MGPKDSEFGRKPSSSVFACGPSLYWYIDQMRRAAVHVAEINYRKATVI